MTKNKVLVLVAAGALLAPALNAQEKKDEKPAQPPAAGAQTPGQPQIRRQYADVVAERLGLNDEQKAKVNALLQEEQKKRQELFQDKNLKPEERLAKMRELREATTAKVKDLLNDEQKTKWEQMRGIRRQPAPPAPPTGDKKEGKPEQKKAEEKK